ncbi:MAG TPA: hypothetical protein VFS30_04885 [Dehalococcoidia bacterium]|nr:hypothetical protein [Dehalococcoidia bacterium]
MADLAGSEASLTEMHAGLATHQTSPAEAQADLARRARQPCPRCQGRMLTSGSEGDLGCFSCGHRIYAVAPEVDLEVRRRGASYGGKSLD